MFILIVEKFRSRSDFKHKIKLSPKPNPYEILDLLEIQNVLSVFDLRYRVALGGHRCFCFLVEKVWCRSDFIQKKH